jgi:UDP-N-acetyl-D-mannosaminuronic acid dehydrogenase
MSIKVLDALKNACSPAEFSLYDPVTPPEVLAAEFPDERICARFGDAVKGAGVVVIANNHPSLGTISPRVISEFIAPGGFIFDFWSHFSRLPAAERGDSYFAVGNIGST